VPAYPLKPWFVARLYYGRAQSNQLFNALTMKNLVLASILIGMTPLVLADVSVNEPWARATVPGQPVGAVYMGRIGKTEKIGR
jgi:copper(I)-binding protein